MARLLSLVPGGGALFRRVVASNRAAAEPMDVPAGFEDRVRAYAAAEPEDGRLLLAALDRRPAFHRGGWVLKLQPRAAAMTLDVDVFVVRNLTARRYVHELVHVEQYGRMGPVRFLEVYFGGSIRGILRRLVRRERLDPMTASPLEAAAYAVDRRFTAWQRAQPS